MWGKKYCDCSPEINLKDVIGMSLLWELKTFIPNFAYIGRNQGSQYQGTKFWCTIIIVHQNFHSDYLFIS